MKGFDSSTGPPSGTPSEDAAGPSVNIRALLSPLRHVTRYGRYLLLKTLRRKEARLQDVRIPLDPSISHAMRKALLMGRYETRESAILPKRLDPQDRVLELGTGIGFTATLCARIVGSESLVTVEANPRMIPLIEKVFRLNGVSPTVYNFIVSATGEDHVLNITDDYWSSSIHARPRVHTRTVVDGCGFEDLVEEVRPSALLVDIEGGEANLVSASIGPSVNKLLMELHRHVVGPTAILRVRGWLSGQGFKVVEDFGDESVLYCERE